MLATEQLRTDFHLEDFVGRTFLDAGCGSGIRSLKTKEKQCFSVFLLF